EVDARVRLVDDREVEFDLRSRRRTARRVARDAMDDGERIRRDECPHPLNDVSVVVVVRRLDQDDLKAAGSSFRRAQHHHNGLPELWGLATQRLSTGTLRMNPKLT